MREYPVVRFMALAALASSIVGCGGADSGPGRAADMLVVSGAAQTGTVGQELANALVVRGVDANGDPMRGQIVNFHVTSGGGSVFAGAAITDADGLARERWTLGTVAGAQSLEAQATDPTSHLTVGPITVEATAVAGPAASVSADDGLPPSPHRSFLVKARVLDIYGNPVAGANVSFVPGDGFGSVSPAAVSTDATGYASSTWTHTDVAGVQTVEARVAGLMPASFHHTVAPGEVFDGTYEGTFTADTILPGEYRLSGPITLIVSDGTAATTPDAPDGAEGSIAADGTVNYQSLPSMGKYNYFRAHFILTEGGGASVSGTYGWSGILTYTVTFSATRQ